MLLASLLSQLCRSTTITCGLQSSNTAAGIYEAQNCLFSCLSSTNGGALYISSSSSNFTCSRCIFSACHASANGAAICIFVYCNLFKTSCGLNCYAGSYGQFIYASTALYGKYYMVSACYCANSSVSSAYDANSFSNGSQTLCSFNSSYNYIQRDASGLIIYSSTASLSYVTVAGCFSAAVATHYDGSTVSVSSMNFINNSQNGSYAGLVFAATSATVNFYSSIFFGNGGYALFCTSSGIITVYNSSISHSLGYGITGTYFVNCLFTSASSIHFKSMAFSLSQTSCIYESDGIYTYSAAFTRDSMIITRSSAFLYVIIFGYS